MVSAKLCRRPFGQTTVRTNASKLPVSVNGPDTINPHLLLYKVREYGLPCHLQALHLMELLYQNSQNSLATVTLASQHLPSLAVTLVSGGQQKVYPHILGAAIWPGAQHF
jgi:hypothetical protein